jgi:glycosyltransferase involved in cell wall biosynthesis
MEKTGSSPKVLFVSSWYPSRVDPLNGIFIKRHAECISKFCSLAVICAVPDETLRTAYGIEYEDGGAIPTVRVYYRTRDRLPHIDLGLRRLIRIMVANYLGYSVVRAKFGKPDLVHVNVGYPAGFFALMLKLTSGLDYLITEHSGEYTFENGQYRRWPVYVRILIRMTFLNARVVTAPSKYLINALKSHGLVRKYEVIPNVVRFPEHLGSKERDKRSRVMALTVSILRDRDKNISGLIKAFGKLARKYPDLELHIVGEGDDREKLEMTAKAVRIMNRTVYFHGYVPPEELGRFFDRANFYVLNSNFETFSVTAAEAIAHGIPVIATRCGGPEEFITKQTGLLIRKADEGELIRALEYMYRNWSRYDGKAIRNDARRRFDTNLVGVTFRALYARLLP